ncbi:MAG TPA: acetyl-CoA C-acetyltransferase [Lacipirellulaceae bacterium]|nr:acetyl-CoA C-acetyltransferase [Lacipirellulaceae bacterium]
MTNDAFILAGVRTPIGSLGGVLSTVPATELGARCIKGVLTKAKVPADEVDEIIMGNVVGAGLGQNPARQAGIKGGLPVSVGAMTINKVCGSGLKAVMLASQSIRLGYSQIVVAGGMENMSLAPYLLPQARQGYRMGNGVLVDSMIHDGLWDVYGNKHMGTYGDQCAAKYKFTRAAQDDFAVRSYTRARKAIAEGIFDDEIVPVEIKGKKGAELVSEDEEPARFNEDKLRALRPAFGSDGTVTAGNASSINDGAAALIVVSDGRCASLRLKPVARIVGAATFSCEPEWFTTAPIGAIKRLLDKVNWTADSVDLFEINEAFSAVTMAAETELELPPNKVNIYGGAVALGHPIGASGARILVTLLNGLKKTNGKRGIASLCIGGGEAVALAVELMNA